MHVLPLLSASQSINLPILASLSIRLLRFPNTLPINLDSRYCNHGARNLRRPCARRIQRNNRRRRQPLLPPYIG
jgi:hypothetical protein